MARSRYSSLSLCMSWPGVFVIELIQDLFFSCGGKLHSRYRTYSQFPRSTRKRVFFFFTRFSYKAYRKDFLSLYLLHGENFYISGIEYYPSTRTGLHSKLEPISMGG